MTKVMYEIPEMKDVKRCIVTEETVLKEKEPILIKENDEKDEKEMKTKNKK